MTNKTLLIMAAGIGSRYGGLKQLDSFGPNGETLLEYSIRDAVSAGFNKVVLVIRPETESLFREQLLPKLGSLPVIFCYQTLDNLPKDCSVDVGDRIKPWGTGHAVWVAHEAIREPFAVINADDYYGADAFIKLSQFLSEHQGIDDQYALVGYLLDHTLSKNGTVSRGICSVDDSGALLSVQEYSGLHALSAEMVEGVDASGAVCQLKPNTRVSMNCWAFPASFFRTLEQELHLFIKAKSADSKAEFYLPHVVDVMLKRKLASAIVLPTDGYWLGVTYPQDKEVVVQCLKTLA